MTEQSTLWFTRVSGGRVNQRASDLLAALTSLATTSGSRLDRLRSAAALLRDSGRYRWVGLYDVDRRGEKVVNIVWDGPGAPEFPEFPTTKGLTGSAIAERKTVNVGDVSVDPRYLTAFGTTRSEIIVPIVNQDAIVVGTIDIESENPNAFDEATERLLEQCAHVLRLLWSGQA